MNIVIDVDGVLADFESAFCQKFGRNGRNHESLENRYPSKTRLISKFVNDPFTYKDLQPIKLGLQICEYLNGLGFDLSIVSSRPLGCEGLTRDWLKRHGVKYLSINISPNKIGTIMLSNPILAIDDLCSIANRLNKHNIPVMLISHPWNQHYLGYFPIIKTFHQFKGIFTEFITFL